MSHFDLSAEQSSSVDFAPTSGLADVKLTHPYRQAYVSPSMSEAAVQERSERVNALIARGLILACIALVIFDLFLLVSGF